MKNRTTIHYNLFYPDFDNDYDEPVRVRSFRRIAKFVTQYGGTFCRVLSHPAGNLAAAYFESHGEILSQRRLLSKVSRKKKLNIRMSGLVQINSAYWKKNRKKDRKLHCIPRAEAERRRRAELEESFNYIPCPEFDDNLEDIPF